MQLTSKSMRRVAASLLFVITSLSGAVAGTFGASAEPVAAARPRPTPVPVPTVAAPSTLTVVSAEANRVIATIDPGSGYTVQLEYVSGPLIAPGPITGSPSPTGFLVDGGQYWFTNLVPDGSYVFRARRTYFYNAATRTGMTVTSPYTNFSFRTPTLAASRPSAPVISILDVSATTLRVSWSPSTDNASGPTQLRYVYRVNGGPEVPTCGSYCFGTTGAVIPRPAAGSSIVVFAIDGAEIRSLVSNTLIAP